MSGIDLEFLSCCDQSFLLDLSKMEIPFLHIRCSEPSLWVAMICVMLHPFYCRMIARWDYNTRKLTALFGSLHRAYAVSTTAAILLGFVRNSWYSSAMHDQDRSYLLQQNSFLWLGYLLIFLGAITTVYTLATVGFAGVYFAEYFRLDVCRPDRACFPYNTFDFPIYWGSIMNYMGVALVRASEAGLMLSALCATSYILAIKWDRHFRRQILRERQCNNHSE